MRKTTLFAFSPALIAIGFGVWAATPANTPVSPSIGQGIEPFQMMVSAKEMPTVEFADYTFVSRTKARSQQLQPYWKAQLRQQTRPRQAQPGPRG